MEPVPVSIKNWFQKKIGGKKREVGAKWNAPKNTGAVKK